MSPPRVPTARDARGGLRRDPLDRDGIIAAALALVDRDGLDALSMRALAEELGVGTMSLYHHVPNKVAVHAGIAELLLSEIDDPAEGTWDSRALAMARSLRQVALAHPHCVPLLVGHPFSSEGSLQPCEAALVLLAEGGFDPGRALLVFRTVVAYVLGFVTMEASGLFADTGPLQDQADLTRLGMDRLAAAVGLLSDTDAEAQFEAGLAIVFTGCLSQLA